MRERDAMDLWEPGQGLVMREGCRSKVYSIFPVRVVQDSPSWTALCLAQQAIGLFPHTREGAALRIPEEDWILNGEPWTGGEILYLVSAGVGYMFSGFWNTEQILKGWKIDLTEPARRERPSGSTGEGATVRP